MFKRRKHVTEWSVGTIAKQTVACFTSDPDQLDVRAAVVLHLDPELLPRNVQSVAYNMIGFAFNEDDRIGIFVEADPTCCAKWLQGADTLDEAKQLAAGWCGEGASERPLRNLPGIYQVAYMQRMTGDEDLGGAGQFGWAIARGSEGMDICREFPPRLVDGEPPTEVGFILIPSPVVDGFQREFGW